MTIAHGWMSPDAIAGWLIPSEFMDVNYGRALKHYLLDAVTLLRIHRFDPAQRQFSDALVSSAIVWLQNRRPAPGHQVDFSYGGSLSHPATRGSMALERLQPEARWTGYPSALRVARRCVAARDAAPCDAAAGDAAPGDVGLRDAALPDASLREPAATTLGDLFRVKRGIATGANKFFIMTAEQAAERGIPRLCLRPILPAARRLASNLVTANEDGEPLIEHGLWLLDCRLPEDHIRARYPRLWQYLEGGRESVGRAYLCSRRVPWYAQERREPAEFLCTYMTRSDAGRFIFNRSQAIVANTYLMLYPREPLTRYIGGDPARTQRVWQALKAIGSSAMMAAGRVYGGGLYKLEPRELGAMPAPALASLLA
jgi:hypothetical protein